MYGDEDKATRDLINWGILERNKVNEVFPTADFLVWYYDYLIHDVTECYGENWEFTVDSDNITEKQAKEAEERDKERDEFIKDCIKNQIVTWTMQRIGNRACAELEVDEHVKIVYDLINDIAARRMEIHTLKTKPTGSVSNTDPDPGLDDVVKEIRERREADLKQRQEAELERKKEVEKQQRKLSDFTL
jgi:alpha-galactosidase/6-phospho-beta-glucosidase family protein